MGAIMMKLTVDRFEGIFAVCELEDGKLVNIPKEALPEEASEGSRLIIEVDTKGTDEDRERIKKKMNGLFKD